MQYVIYRRFRGKCLSGDVDLKIGTICESRITKTILGNSEVITHDKDNLCLTTSQYAYDYFSRNDDKRGLERGNLVLKIKTLLRTPSNPANFPLYDRRWDAIWGDESLLRFKRKEQEDYWLWNHDFYNASIEDLEYILKVVKGVK